MENLPVTVVVPVKNEEKNLPLCLNRLAKFSQVVVVDSGSTDSTVQIARAAGAEVLQFDWNGEYPKKRNWVLSNYQFRTPWVLFLDADEFIGPEFVAAVALALKETSHSGFWLNYANYFLGKRLNHGLRQRKLALFRVGSGFYERIDEKRWSQLDMEIHEHPIVSGSVGTISEPIDHRDFRGVGKHLTRHIDYAFWEAHRHEDFGRKGGDQQQLTRRQRLKYRNMVSWWFPWAFFLYTYVLKFGFLDGRAGFHYAFYKLWYLLTIRLVILEELPTAADGKVEK